MNDLLPFLRLLKPHRDWVIWAIVCGCLTLMASIGLLAVSGWFLSATAVAGLSIVAAQNFNIFTPSAGIRGFAVVRTAGRYVERVMSHEATLRLLASLRVWFYRRIEPQAPASLYRHRSSDLLGRIVTDIDTLDGLFIRVLSPTVVALCVAVVGGAFLWWLTPLLALVFLGFFLAAGALLPLVSRHLGQRSGTLIQHQLALFRMNLVEDLQGMADLIIYGAWQRHCRLRLEENDRLLELQEKMARISGFNSAMMTLLSGLAAVAALYLAIPFAQHGYFDGALLALITFGVLAAFEAVLPLPLAYQMLGKIRAAARRIRAIADAPTIVTFPVASSGTPADTSVRYCEVDFTYPGATQTPALTGVNLILPQHSTLALIGPSGCGKTTLAHLLTRFWDPDRGEISIGGEDVRHFTEEQLRHMITLVSQSSHIFNATLRDNLLIADPAADATALWDALARAQLADFVAALPQGLETWAGEGGARLSGGQARRLILARALLKNSPVWILDEPTEGLDSETARQFTETLFANLGTKSVLFISHTSDVLARVDQVCFMQNGHIVSHGTHHQLLTDCDRYRQFISS